MKIVEILNETRQPVPKLSQLWKWSDEFSDETNEKARRMAMDEIERIKKQNAEGATKRKQYTKDFQTQEFESFGIKPKSYLRDYISSMMKFIKKDPDAAQDYFVDPSEVTKENMIDELIKKAKQDKEKDPEQFVAIEVFLNPGRDVENKYGEKYKALSSYWDSIRRLNPAARKKAVDALTTELKAVLKE
jgi:hypothetical protein